MRGRRFKYPFTGEQDEYLRRIYVEHAHDRRKLHEALVAFARRIGYRRDVLTTRARKLGITVPHHHRPWSREEDTKLQEMAGSKSTKTIAGILKRGFNAVHCRMKRLELSARLTEGYSRKDIAEVMGVSAEIAGAWIARGYIRPSRGTGRANEQEMRRFLREHSEQYDIRRVDQPWFKGMIFPTFGLITLGERRRPSQMEVAGELELRA